jgi:hypothetical protein
LAVSAIATDFGFTIAEAGNANADALISCTPIRFFPQHIVLYNRG